MCGVKNNSDILSIIFFSCLDPQGELLGRPALPSHSSWQLAPWAAGLQPTRPWVLVNSPFHSHQNCKENHMFPGAITTMGPGIASEQHPRGSNTSNHNWHHEWESESAEGGHKKQLTLKHFPYFCQNTGFDLGEPTQNNMWTSWFPPSRNHYLSSVISQDYLLQETSSDEASWFLCYCSWLNNLKYRGQNEINKKKEGQTFHQVQEFCFAVAWSNVSFPLKFIPPALKLIK